ncbi:MAG: hypothetical protein ACK42Y_06445 [Candidatus Thermochlorobacter sp.]
MNRHLHLNAAERVIRWTMCIALLSLRLLMPKQSHAQPYSMIDTPLRQLTFETSYGFANLSLPEFAQPIASTLHLEAMFGIKRYLFSRHSKALVDYAHPHAFASYYTVLTAPAQTGIGAKTVTMTLFRIGLGIRDGIGYRLENMAITPTINSAMLLARPVFSRLPQDPDSASRAVRFSALHFGTLTAAGIELQAAAMFAINFNYDWMLLFPKFMPWQFIGSHILQWGLQIGAGYFIDAVFGAAPQLLPVAHFLLKNALNFALYTLRLNRMHFPFESEAPLSVQTFKVGISFYIGPKILD